MKSFRNTWILCGKSTRSGVKILEKFKSQRKSIVSCEADHLGKVIVVTGSPCVGKTSVSHVLAKKLDALHIDIAELVKSEKLFRGVDRKRQSLIADLEKVSKRIKEISESSSGLVIVDGHYAVNVVPKKKVQQIFVLRKHPEELKRLMEQRGFQGAKLWENLAVEVLDVCLYDAVSFFGVGRICEIDTTGRSIEDIVDEMIAVIDGKRTCGMGHVDWLGKLESEGCLKEYLKDF